MDYRQRTKGDEGPGKKDIVHKEERKNDKGNAWATVTLVTGKTSIWSLGMPLSHKGGKERIPSS